MNLLNCCFKQKHLSDRLLVAYKCFSNWINEVYKLLFKHSHWRNLPVALFFLKEHSIFLEIGSIYNSPRVKQLSFTIFESIQPISRLGLALLA